MNRRSFLESLAAASSAILAGGLVLPSGRAVASAPAVLAPKALKAREISGYLASLLKGAAPIRADLEYAHDGPSKVVATYLVNEDGRPFSPSTLEGTLIEWTQGRLPVWFDVEDEFTSRPVIGKDGRWGRWKKVPTGRKHVTVEWM